MPSLHPETISVPLGERQTQLHTRLGTWLGVGAGVGVGGGVGREADAIAHEVGHLKGHWGEVWHCEGASGRGIGALGHGGMGALGRWGVGAVGHWVGAALGIWAFGHWGITRAVAGRPWGYYLDAEQLGHGVRVPYPNVGGRAGDEELGVAW